MSTLSTGKRSAPWRRYCAAAITAALLLAAFFYWQDGSEQVAQQNRPAPVQKEVFGPGLLTKTDAGASLANREEESYKVAPGGLTADANQHLVINSALLRAINFYLLEQADPDRASQLRSYLKKSLPPPAYGEAAEIVEHYQSYMKAHDEFLAGQNLGNQDIGARLRDINRLLSWRDQRNRLRQDMLGDKVVQAWYQEDDAQLAEVLNELQQRAANGTGESDTANEQQRDQYLQQTVDQATKSFATLAVEGRQWATHFAAFLDASKQINQQTGLGALERNRQIQELLVRTFSTETERQRARDMSPLN